MKPEAERSVVRGGAKARLSDVSKHDSWVLVAHGACRDHRPDALCHSRHVQRQSVTDRKREWAVSIAALSLGGESLRL